MPLGPRAVVCLAAATLLVVSARGSEAQRLPIQAFGTDTGLPSASVACVVPDRNGFLWFCTSEGLARFDGTAFRTYTAEDGLPHANVTAFLEARDGTYWVGTANGLAHFDPRPPAPGQVGGARPLLFRVVAPSAMAPASAGRLNQAVFPISRSPVHAIHEDPSGAVWCGTGDGVYRVRREGHALTLEDAGVAIRPPATVRALLTDRRGRLWIGASSGLYRREANGTVVDFGDEGFLEPGINHNVVNALFESRDGWIWVGTEHAGLRLLSLDAVPGPRVWTQKWVDTTGIMNDRASDVVQGADGTIWWVGMHGLRSLTQTRAGDWRDASLQTLGVDSGLPSLVFERLAEDRLGDLWLAADGAGVVRVTRRGFVTFTEADGLDSRAVHAITGAGDRSVVVITSRARGSWHHNRFDGRRFQPVRFNIPHDDWGWGWSQLSFQDPLGRWWLPTGQATYRSPPGVPFSRLDTVPFYKFPSPFPPQAFLRAGRLITDFSNSPDELQAWATFRLFPDSHGYVWAGTMNRVGGHETPNEVVRWDPATDRFAPFPNDDKDFIPMAFAEDRTGAVWIGGYNGGLRRARPRARRLEDFSTIVPSGQVRALLVDARGRLWVATSEGGVVCLDGLESVPFVAQRYGLNEGLTSLNASALVDDLLGRVYIGHARGIDVVGANGAIERTYTSADGLAAGPVWCAYRDASGALWFGTLMGLSRLMPVAEIAASAPRLVITGISTGGQPVGISEVGETSVASLEVPAGAATMQIQYAVLGASSPPTVRYQYRVDGGSAEWSAPSARRSVEFARLGAGSYRFLVRAVSPSGTILSEPAVVSFTVLAPVWARWWFIALAAAASSAGLYGLHRLRMARVVAVERVRLHVARDLHDELGANLARLAILGEVAQRDPSRATTVLADVSSTARRLVDALGEVVWFVDPRKDDVASVVDLVAAHGRDLFEPLGVAWTCHVPAEATGAKLSAQVRRELYLILKEAVTNAARHSGCTRASLRVAIGDGRGVMSVSDNGRGIDSAAGRGDEHRGNGLRNMRARAEAIGATLDFGSVSPGLVVRVSVPLGR